MNHSFHKYIKQHNCFHQWKYEELLPVQHIRVISGGSCDTEDWSNDAEDSALHHKNKLHFKIY